jgi:hypothetical protein
MSKEEAYAVAEVKNAEQNGLYNGDVIPTKTKPWWKFGGKDYSFVSVNAGYTSTASSSETKLESTEKLGRNVYETDEAKDIYKPIQGYEGAHRFDPQFKWSPEEEKRLVKTVSVLSLYSKLNLIK